MFTGGRGSGGHLGFFPVSMAQIIWEKLPKMNIHVHVPGTCMIFSELYLASNIDYRFIVIENFQKNSSDKGLKVEAGSFGLKQPDNVTTDVT
jgi:hypothetical protein